VFLRAFLASVALQSSLVFRPSSQTLSSRDNAVMASLFFGLSWLLLALFAVLCIWALIVVTQKKTELPASYYLVLNATHIAWIATLTAGFVSSGGSLGLRFVIEYTLAYVGGGVLYSRGLIKDGFMWKILTDPPKVPWGMMMANGWAFAAVLGYIARVGG
jgi:hypothetical protein